MAHTELVDVDLPLGQRLLRGLGYPMSGGGLSACIALALCSYLTLLPMLIGFAIKLLLCAAAFGYAIDGMVSTADGYAQLPEVSLSHTGSPKGVTFVYVLILLAGMAIPHAFWPALAFAVLVMPAMVMSLAFDGDFFLATNPATWVRVVKRFGMAYLVPVLSNVVILAVIWLLPPMRAWLPGLLYPPVFGFCFTYLVLLNFHWMGLCIWHHRERLGMTPGAPKQASAAGQDADEMLASECKALAENDLELAAMRLRDRIRKRMAPASIHLLFRELARKLGRNDVLLDHAQAWITQLCTNGEARRALGLVQECRDIDPAFSPAAPDDTEMLAHLASRMGMRDLASHLARSILERWPQGEAAGRLGDMADPAPEGRKL
ncbi:MAG TPA: hypothetical protein VFG67_01720 [Oleiagrimonas sp.]|nr:hypothetical protein [Oleiagrimonas sp.]